MQQGRERAEGPTLHRREFLAVASSAAITPLALGTMALEAPAAAPTSATLVPEVMPELMGELIDGPVRGRFATRPPMTLSHSACRLTIETIESAAGADGAASVEVVYPVPGAQHVAWAARGEEVPGPITTLAPTDALGRVRLRVSVGGVGDVGGEPVVREFVYPSTPATHVLAIPMRSGARLPSWRRCGAQMSGGRIDGVIDDWRPSGAAPGCVLLRVTLSPLSDDLNVNSPNNNDENRAGQTAPMEAPDAR